MKRLILAAFIGLLSVSSHANIEFDTNYEITVSKDEYSVLEVVGKKITNVDVELKHCEIEPERSRKLGKLVFKPTGKESFTAFITDEDGVTYPVKINPSNNLKADLYKISKPVPPTTLSQAEILALSQSQTGISLQDSRTKIVANFLKSMVEGIAPSNVTVKKTEEEMYLWNEVKFKKLQTNLLGNMKAIKYEIVNISNEKMVLNEKEFYLVQPGVMAIVIENPIVEVGQKTFVYIVSSEG